MFESKKIWVGVVNEIHVPAVDPEVDPDQEVEAVVPQHIPPLEGVQIVT